MRVPRSFSRYTLNVATVLELYEKLKPKLGEGEARALLEFVETSVEQRAATKEDLQRTASVAREDLQRTASALEAALRKDIQDVRVDLLKWSFAFWVGAIAVLSGIMFTMLRSLPAR